MNNILFNWSEQKNEILRKNRNISFEQVVISIQNGNLLDIIVNPSSNFIEQQCFVVNINQYAYLVPYVENENEIFLKTIYPSRKFTKIFLRSRL